MLTTVVNLIRGAQAREVKPEHLVVVLCQEGRIRDLAVTWLRQIGVRIEVTQNGPTAQVLLSQTGSSGCTLVTDRVFPPWPGLMPIRQLKKQVPGLRVVVVHEGDENVGDVAYAAGADAGLGRPLNRRELFAALGVTSERVSSAFDTGVALMRQRIEEVARGGRHSWLGLSAWRKRRRETKSEQDAPILSAVHHEAIAAELLGSVQPILRNRE